MKCIWIQPHLLFNSSLNIKHVKEMCQGKKLASYTDLLPSGVCALPFIKHDMRYIDMSRGHHCYTSMECLTVKIDQSETQY